MSQIAILVEGPVATEIWVGVSTTHAVARVPQTWAVATIPGMKFAPMTVTVPPAYTMLGDMTPLAEEEVVPVPEPVEPDVVFEEPDVVFEVFETALEGESCPGIAIICKNFGWLLTYASEGLLKLTNTMQLEGVKSFDTTILISASEDMLQLEAGTLQTLAKHDCEVMKFFPVNVTVKPG